MLKTISARASTFIAALLLIVCGLTVQPAAGQGVGSPSEAQQSERIDFRNRTEFEISDPAEVPAQVARITQQSSCDYKARIKQFPLHFISIERRRFVLVYCDHIVGTHQVFDLSNLRSPKPIMFPFLARDSGFGATPRPGLITWKKDSGVFEAVTGTDTCPSSQLRHVYRLGMTEGWASGEPTFVLIRVDVMENRCAGRLVGDGVGSAAMAAHYDCPVSSRVVGHDGSVRHLFQDRQQCADALTRAPISCTARIARPILPLAARTTATDRRWLSRARDDLAVLSA
jgi:hypothetical protein